MTSLRPRPWPPAPAIVPPSTHGAPSLLWRDCLARHRNAVAGSRTWDLYRDIYSPAADELFAGGAMNDLIGLTIDYIVTVKGTKLTGAERARVSQVVRMHGKAMLYGYHEALARVDDVGINAATTYATAVARSAHHKIRTRQQEATTT